MKNYWKGMACCLTAAIAWGISFSVMEEALQAVDPFNFTALRYSAAGIIFVVVLLYKEGASAFRLVGERYLLAWLLGSAGFCGYGFFIFHGQQLAGPDGARSAAVVIATTPMLTVLVNWFLRGIAPTRISLACIGTSFLGVIMVITQGNFQALTGHSVTVSSTAFLMIGAISWSVYTIGNAYFPHWSAYRYTTMTTLLGLITIHLVNLSLRLTGVVPAPSTEAVLRVTPHLAYMILIAGVLAVLCWNVGNKIVTPANGVLFLDFVPVTAFMMALIQGTPVGQWQWGGAFLSGAALVVNNLHLRQQLFLSEKGTKRIPTASRRC